MLIHFSALAFSIMLGIVLDYWWVFWISMEISLWAMIPLMFKTFDNLVAFIFWQSLSSLFFILFYVLSMSKWVILIFLFKMSLPPFHSWFLILLKNVPWKFFIFFSYLTKIPYIFIFSNMWFQSLMNFLMLFPLFMFIYFWMCINFKFLIWAISISDFPWAYFSSKSFHTMFIYIFLMVLMVFMMVGISNIFPFLLGALFMLSLPPFSLFQIKMMITSFIPLIKMTGFLLLLIINSLFIWVFIFIKWFQFSIKCFKMNFFSVKTFLMMNLLWVIF